MRNIDDTWVCGHLSACLGNGGSYNLLSEPRTPPRIGFNGSYLSSGGTHFRNNSLFLIENAGKEIEREQ
jgi:hypothetical protein